MKKSAAILPYLKLYLNIDHPELEECYSHGYESAAAGIHEEENPFVIGTQEYKWWEEGWWAGFYGEEPLFVLTKTKAGKPVIKTAANDLAYQRSNDGFFAALFKITSALAATAVVGYQVFDLVA